MKELIVGTGFIILFIIITHILGLIFNKISGNLVEDTEGIFILGIFGWILIIIIAAILLIGYVIGQILLN